MRRPSLKIRITAWFALMMFVIEALVLSFLLAVNGTIVTNGGRVVGESAPGNDLKEARKKAYEATEWVSFENKYMRHDIGRAIDEA